MAESRLRVARQSAFGAMRVWDRQIGKEMVMSTAWNKDVDKALANARTSRRPVLLDFNAAPM